MNKFDCVPGWASNLAYRLFSQWANSPPGANPSSVGYSRLSQAWYCKNGLCEGPVKDRNAPKVFLVPAQACVAYCMYPTKNQTIAFCLCPCNARKDITDKFCSMSHKSTIQSSSFHLESECWMGKSRPKIVLPRLRAGKFCFLPFFVFWLLPARYFLSAACTLYRHFVLVSQILSCRNVFLCVWFHFLWSTFSTVFFHNPIQELCSSFCSYKFSDEQFCLKCQRVPVQRSYALTTKALSSFFCIKTSLCNCLQVGRPYDCQLHILWCVGLLAENAIIIHISLHEYHTNNYHMGYHVLSRPNAF